MPPNAGRTALFVSLATVVSAVAYFFGTGLHPVWYLTWLAPLPVLLLAPRVPRSISACAAFMAFTCGALNTWRFYQLVIPLPLRLVILLAMSVVFAAVVLAFRTAWLRREWIRAVLLPPAIWVAVEYLVEFRSPNSTSNNLAYSQMDNLHVLQLVSLTGIWGISFLLFLLPAGLAILTAPQADVYRGRVALAVAVVAAMVLGYGQWRLHATRRGSSLMVAMIDSDAPQTLFPSGGDALQLVHAYADRIPALAQAGAQIVILPEKIGRLSASQVGEADQILGHAAAASHVRVLAGFEQSRRLNESHLYAASGAVEATYEKHHMVPAFESRLLPGTTRTLVDGPAGRLGLTICKDMDFPLLSRQYALDGAGLMLVPAWDFSLDGWLHDRMAVMRGVESGFSIARSARQGLLSISDDRGRVLAERNTNGAPFVTLIASVPVRNEPTFYARSGDWFAWLDLAMLPVLLLWPARRGGA